MKYYFPTSSLNLDTVLQAECISPASFYTQRNSGYRRLEVIPQLQAYDSIVLFDYPVEFSIIDQERINYPMLIEIDDDAQLSTKLAAEGNGIYTFPTTIYLSPYNCRIFFFNAQQYNNTVVLTQGEKGIKYYKEFIIQPDCGLLSLKEMPSVSIPNRQIEDSEENEYDQRKGCVYGCLLGQSLSKTPAVAKQAYLGQKIYDVATGLLAQQPYSPKLLNQLSVLLDEYKKADTLERETELFFDKIFCDQAELLRSNRRFPKVRFARMAIALLKMLGLWDAVCEILAERHGIKRIKYPEITVQTPPAQLEWLRDDIEKRTRTAIERFASIQPTTKIQLHGGDICLSGAEIINSAIHCIISYHITLDSLRADPLGTLKILVNPYKDRIINTFGEQFWKESDEREYTNSLARHLKNPALPFNLKGCENVELQSIAAFVLQGYGMESLKKYLIINEFQIYTFPFALWGAARGYQEMHREQLSNILTLDRCAFVLEFLTGIRSDRNAKSRWLKEDALAMVKPEDAMTIKAIEQAIERESKQGDYDAYLFILNNLIPDNHKVFISLKDAIQKEKGKGYSLEEIVENTLESINSTRRTILEDKEKARWALVLEDRIGDPYAFCLMLEDYGVSQDMQKKFCQHFHLPMETLVFQGRPMGARIMPKDSVIASQTTIFDKKPPFFADKQAWSIVSECIKGESIDVQEIVKDNLEWLQTSYMNGKNRDQTKDNISVINHFYNLIKTKIPNVDLINTIKQRLLECYCK